VAGHVCDLDQVGAKLHRGGHEAGPQAVAGKGRVGFNTNEASEASSPSLDGAKGAQTVDNAVGIP
jgi:hypothetical protein